MQAGEEVPDVPTRTVVQDGMRIDWHVGISMNDGEVLRADVFRPIEDGEYPAILTYGPYAKGLAFQDFYRTQWEKLVHDYPEVLVGSSNKYQNWEAVDPEKWVSDGYACVRVDSRGAGWSPGVLDVWSPREAQDFFECIEWAARQPWCSGKVGLLGISYYAMNQWQVAGLQPPHLAAMIPWEGAADLYRDAYYHGGILSNFPNWWFPKQVSSVQYGLGDRAARSRVTGESVAGPVTLDDEELRANRVELGTEVKRHPLNDRWHQDRSAQWERIKVPFLSAANWGGQGLHTRGNFEAFTDAATRDKWLEVHGGDHWSKFYSDDGITLQKRFFGHFLKDESTGWDTQPPVYLHVRHVDHFVGRGENEWPLARTQWTKLFLRSEDCSLDTDAPANDDAIRYEALGEGVTFTSQPFVEETEITGPLAARVYISSTTVDADLFVAVRLFDPSGTEICFQGAQDPNTPIGLGWLRASHRKLDPTRSRPEKPYHTHDQLQPLVPGEIYSLDVEIWPTCIVVPVGYQLALTIRGRDYQSSLPVPDWAKTWSYAGQGIPPNFMHVDPDDRPAEIFESKIDLHTGGERASYLLIPIIPAAMAD